MTLSKRGTVLEYLAEIAGDDPGAALDIPYWSNGWYALNVREVAIWKATTQTEPLSQSSSNRTAVLLYQSRIARTVQASSPRLSGSDRIQPLASSSDPCRLLSVSYIKGLRYLVKIYPGLKKNNTCGYMEKWSINSVTYCNGDNCSGQQITESVQGTGSLDNPNPQCQIEDEGTMSAGCIDYYGACGPAPLPPGGISGTITQTISVGGGATGISNTITTTLTLRSRYRNAVSGSGGDASTMLRK